MTEKIPTFENEESPEQQLIRLLKEKGAGDLETRESLDNWTREQEKRVEQSDDYHLEQIQFNFRRARLYFEAGYVDEAFENFEAARMQAWNEQREELYQAIIKKMDELEHSIEKINFLVFNEYFPNAEIKEIVLSDIPEKVLEYFEFKSSQFISPNQYKPNNFERFFAVKYADNNTTFLAQQTKMYDNGDAEKLTFFADVIEKDVIGRAELRLNVKCAIENEEYFKNKPFVGWTETNEDLRKSGMGTRRLFLMNAIAQMCYGLPLYSDTVNSPQMKKIWEKLVESGNAIKFKEGDKDRYKITLKNLK